MLKDIYKDDITPLRAFMATLKGIAKNKIGKQKAQHKRQQDRQQIIETYIDDRADDGDVYCVDNKFFTFFHIFIMILNFLQKCQK